MIAKIDSDNKIHVFDTKQFDIDAILHSGQVFRYFQISGGWRVVVGTNYADVFTTQNAVEIITNNAQFFYKYFDFGRNYAPITASFDRHTHLAHVFAFGQGLRILRGEFKETVISFILSANNNIKRFTKTLNALCEKCGAKLECGEFGFPSLEDLSKLGEADFKELSCGYRSAYLVKTIKMLLSPDFDFEVLNKLSNEQLYKELRKLVGVGDKVARCIMLFCFNRLSIAPIDTWMEKACHKIFNTQEEKRLSSKKMAEKFETYFGEYAGVAQQFIFYYTQYLRKEL